MTENKIATSLRMTSILYVLLHPYILESVYVWIYLNTVILYKSKHIQDVTTLFFSVFSI